MAEKTTVKVYAAPKIGSGDSIELTPLIGKVCGVQITARQEIDTKFGNRKMSTARIVVEGSPDPLEGILFQSYFQGLDLKEWYIGTMTLQKRGNNNMWGLDAAAVNKTAVSKVVKTIEALPSDEDVPF